MADSALQTFGEEIANLVTHAAGFLLSVFGLIWMLYVSLVDENVFQIAATATFGGSMVFLYAASSLYHGCRRPSLKRVWQIVDHCAVYVLIAGSYTPIMVIGLNNGAGWMMLSFIWILALGGIVYKIWFIGRYRIFSVATYLVMGWLAVLAVRPIVQTIPADIIFWIVAGGLSYTTGIIFYAWNRLPFNHAVWHLFVLMGSLCHFIAVALLIAP